jgi:phosphomannomutase
VELRGRTLARLPTRDAILPILALLASAAEARLTVAELVVRLPVRPALSDRLTGVPPEAAAAFVARLSEDTNYGQKFMGEAGEIAEISRIDGPRFTLTSGDIIHYRPSGNAPELRCYVEGATEARVAELLAWGLAAAARAVR